jgi:hypothetical protein
MNTSDMLTEILAIVLYEHDCHFAHVRPIWVDQCAEDRQNYRDRVQAAQHPEDLYPSADIEQRAA